MLFTISNIGWVLGEHWPLSVHSAYFTPVVSIFTLNGSKLTWYPAAAPLNKNTCKRKWLHWQDKRENASPFGGHFQLTRPLGSTSRKTGAGQLLYLKGRSFPPFDVFVATAAVAFATVTYSRSGFDAAWTSAPRPLDNASSLCGVWRAR